MKRRLPIGSSVLTVVVLMACANVVVVAGENGGGDTPPHKVKLQIDKPYCLLNFMETLQDERVLRPDALRRQKSKYSGDEELAQLRSAVFQHENRVRVSLRRISQIQVHG